MTDPVLSLGDEEIVVDLSRYFKPHPVQSYILRCRARWVLLECGRRFGKGRAAIFWILKHYLVLMSKPRPASLVPVVHIGVFVPSLNSITVPWLELKKFVPPELVLKIDEGAHTIDLLGGGLIEVRSADIRAIQQGVGYDMIWITEADKIERSVFNDIVPMLRSPFRAGLAWIESKPYQETGWFHELFQMGQHPTKQLESFHFSTLTNPFVDWDEIEFDRQIMTDRDWSREYLAEIESGSEAAFPSWKVGLMPLDWQAPSPNSSHFYHVGVDLGKQVDYTVISVFDLCTREIVYIDRFQTAWEEVRRRVAATSKLYNTQGCPAPVYIDTTGKGEPVVAQLITEEPDLPIYGVDINQTVRYQLFSRMALGIEKGDLRYPNWEPLSKELALMKRISKAPCDQFKMTGGRQHDDIVFSIALAYTREQISDVTVSYTRSRMIEK
jgi:hypothetical protein